MTYLEERKGRGPGPKRVKYYLCQTVRKGKKTHKISIYLGTGPLSVEELRQLEQQKYSLLKERISAFRGSREMADTAQLNALLSAQQKKELDLIKSLYREDQSLLTTDERAVLESDFLTDYAYQTTKIEGSTLSYKNAELILKHGQVPKYKELRDVYGLQNIVSAWNYLSQYRGECTEQFIKEIHRMVMNNILESAGTYRELQVYMGRGRFASKHVPPSPDEVSQEMKRLVRWIKESQQVYPVIRAGAVHHLFIAIHPFLDGNGRVGRLLLYYFLHSSGFPPVNILNKEKIKYIACLEKARDGNLKPFVDFISHHLLQYKSPLSPKTKGQRRKTT